VAREQQQQSRCGARLQQQQQPVARETTTSTTNQIGLEQHGDADSSHDTECHDYVGKYKKVKIASSIT